MRLLHLRAVFAEYWPAAHKRYSIPDRLPIYILQIVSVEIIYLTDVVSENMVFSCPSPSFGNQDITSRNLTQLNFYLNKMANKT